MKNIILSLALAALVVSASSAAAREWTDAEGRKIQAEFVEVKGEGDAAVAVLQMAGGKSYDVPLSTLSAADQAYAKEEQAKRAAAGPSSATPADVKDDEKSEAAAGESMKKLLEGKLVALSGKRVGKFEQPGDPEYYAFYFSASWCGPCKQFTPKLVDFYKSNKEAGKTFQVVFVSRDHSEKDMEEYIKEDEMPWPAIAFRQVDRLKEVKKYAGSGIPCLVLVDRAGKVISHSYVEGKYVGPQKVMADLEKQVAAK